MSVEELRQRRVVPWRARHEFAALGATRRLAVTSALPIGWRALLVRLRLDAGWGRMLPPQATFLLGGSDGFPGIVAGERWGDRTLASGLTARAPLTGPISVPFDVAGGAATFGGPVVARSSWLVGVGAGLRVPTPLGAARATYGRASTGRGALFVSVGR